jgi:hypothetical protein
LVCICASGALDSATCEPLVAADHHCPLHGSLAFSNRAFLRTEMVESFACGWGAPSVSLSFHNVCEVKDGLCPLIGVLGWFRARLALAG